MANPTPNKKLTQDEEAELSRLQAEETAKAEALAALEVQQKATENSAAAAAALAPRQSPPRAVPVKFAGDVPVTTLKSENFVKLGDRSYRLVKGQEVMMDPSHAEELSQGESPWVAKVTVHRVA